ncbi:FAD-binding protein [Hamadaea tsunoensis]|uniref:FAD-binding protein n=1 Tax=Hamadaea tsunoensis TaxID=53368 RepID=UPI00040C9E30|nr:FAD-binding protein [Hamadaea tsunoensis]
MLNWAGNVTFAAARVHRPSTLDELRHTLAGAAKVRVLGSAHSFNRLADTTGDLVSLAGLPPAVDIDTAASTVRVSGGLRYGEVAEALHAAGYALPNLASLPHISIAGAVATGTHGSGVRNGNLATSVRAIELVTAAGDVIGLDRSDPRFPGSVVALGALGAVTALTLDLVPTFQVRQDVYTGLPFDAPITEVLADGYSVSLFTDFAFSGPAAPRFTQVWRKALPDDPGPAEFFGARPATGRKHPIEGVDPAACTEQGGVPGAWHERLPHFRLAFTPSSGDELQTEYFVPLADGPAALAALAPLAARIAPLLLVSEIRTVAADDLWLSPASGRATMAFHFTWRPLTEQVTALLPAIEAALSPFGVRAHWGKLFTLATDVVRSGYPHMSEFVALAHHLDPAGKFRNDFMETYLTD